MWNHSSAFASDGIIIDSIQGERVQPMWNARDNPDQLPPAAMTGRKRVDFTDVMAWMIVVVWIVFWLTASFWVGMVDDSGWIPHSHDTPVWIGGEWLTGEYRVCKMPLMPRHNLPSSAHLLCGQIYDQDVDAWPVDFIGSIPNHDFYELMGSNWAAVDQYFHVLPVKYWGRIDRTGRLNFSWRCQRQESGLVCDAIN